MDFQEAMNNLRSRLKEARDQSLEGGFEMSEQMLEQVAMEAERFRKECIRQADSLDAQAKAARWQADAYNGVAAMVYRIFSGFVSLEEKRLAEVRAAEAEKREQAMAEKVAAEPAAEPAAEEKPRRKKAEKPVE